MNHFLSAQYALAGEDIEAFRRDGHILLRNVASAPIVQSIQPIVHEVSHAHNAEKRKLEERDTYGKAFLQTTNLWRYNASIQAFVFAKRFAGIAASLLGVDRVRLYHDQALYKEPHGGHTPWHQDQYYWPLDTDKTITMWMPLVDIAESMGVMAFASGSHRQGFIQNTAISDNSEHFFLDYISRNNFPVARPSFMSAGDATFHAGWTIHSASPNKSNTIREVFTIIYFADGARIIPSQNEHQEADRVAWLGGLEPGKEAAGELNPLLGEGS